MIVKGTTRHRLNDIKTYDPNNPYVVGVNGVEEILDNEDGSKSVRYVIGNIEYVTKLVKIVDPNNPFSTLLNNSYNISKPYVPNRFEPNGSFEEIYPTTFTYVTENVINDDDYESYYIFKDDTKSGVVFRPKIKEDVFIDRKEFSVFEKQSRLSNIKSLDDLEKYNNGYYNIVKEE